MTTRGDHGLVNETGSAQTQPPSSEPMIGRRAHRPRRCSATRCEKDSRREPERRSHSVTRGRVVGERLGIGFDAVRVLCGHDRKGMRGFWPLLVRVADEQADDREGQLRQLERLDDGACDRRSSRR